MLTITLFFLFLMIIISFFNFEKRKEIESEIELLRYNIPAATCEFLLDESFTIISFAKDFTELTGYSKKNIEKEIDSKYAKLLVFSDFDNLKQDLKEQLSKGKTATGKCRIIKRNGQSIWVVYNGIKLENKETPIFKMIFFEIRENKQRHDESMPKKNGLETSNQDIPAGILILNTEHAMQLVSMNQCALEILGYTYDEAVNGYKEDSMFFIHPDDIAYVREITQYALASGMCKSYTHRIIAKSQSVFHVVASVCFFQDHNDMKNMMIVFMDITKILKQDQRLKLTDEKYQIAMQQANVFILEYEMKSKTIELSVNAQEYTGLPHTILFSRTHLKELDILCLQDFDTFNQIIQQILNQEQMASCELRLKNKNGIYKWFKLMLVNIFNAQGTAVKIMATLLYIDEEKQAKICLEQEKKYRDSMLKKALLIYEADLTQDVFIKGQENLFRLFNIEENFSYSDVVEYAGDYILLPEDGQKFKEQLNVENLKKCFDSGITEVIVEARRYDNLAQYVHLKYIVNIILNDETGHLMAFCHIIKL